MIFSGDIIFVRLDKYIKKRYVGEQLVVRIVFCFIITIYILNYSLIPQVFSEQQQQKQEIELKFVEKLVENSSRGLFNFFDIAEEIVLEIKNKPLSKEIQQEAFFIWGKLKKSQAEAEKDFDLRAKLSDEAIEILNKFISENKDYSRLVDVKFEVAELLGGKGMFNSAVLKIEADPSKKQNFIQQAELSFKQAAEYLGEMISYYQKTLMEESTSQLKKEEIENDVVRAFYLQGVDFYNWALLYGKTEENRKKYLQEAIKVLKDLILRYGEKIVSYETADYLGLCYYELEDYSTAKSYFSMTASLYDIIMKEPDKSKQEKNELLEDSKDVIQKGFTHLAMVSNATKEYVQSIRIIDDLVKMFPKDKSDEWIERGILEKANALFYTNAKDKALSIVQEIIKQTQNNSVRSLARDVLSLIVQGGGGEGGRSLEIIIGTMRDLFSKNKLRETILRGQELMNLLNNSSEEVKIQYLPEVLYIIGESLRSQERYYEAAIIYEVIYLNPKYKNIQSTKKEAIAPLAAYGAASVYRKMNALTGDESDRLKYKETLSYLVKNWPDSDPAKEVQYFEAKGKEEEGKFPEAADSYTKVLPSSKFYPEAKFRTGLMYYSIVDKQLDSSYKEENDATKKETIKGEISRYLLLSEESFNNAIKFFGDKLKEPLDEETKNKILSLDISSRSFLSRVYLHDFNRKYKEVLEILSGLEKKHPTAINQILQLKIEAFVRMGDLNNAEIYLRELKNYAVKDNTPEIAAFSLQLIAFTYEEIANNIIAPASTPEEREKRREKIAEKKEKSPGEYKKFTDSLQRSCECFSQWVEVRKKTITPGEVLTVANKLYQAAEETKKNDFYAKASNFYERIMDKEFQNKLPTSQEIWIVEWQMAKTYRALGEKLKASNILEKLNDEPPNNIDIKDIKRELAFVYDELGSMEKTTYWQLAKRKWVELGKLLKEQSEGWWETKYCYIMIDYKAGNFKEALHSMNMIENAINKNYDDDKWGYKTKFLDLKKKVEEKTGGK